MWNCSLAVVISFLMSAFLLQFRNPKASLHTRLSDLIKHLQKKGERHCQEFYRALQINAEQLYNDLPSRKILSKLICNLTELSISSSVNYETSFHFFCSDYLNDYLFIPHMWIWLHSCSLLAGVGCLKFFDSLEIWVCAFETAQFLHVR